MKNLATEVARTVERRLREFQLLNQYTAEELSPRDEEEKGPSLLHHVEAEIRGVLGAEYEIVTQSWDLTGRDFVSAFGHSFWPDIFVRRGDTDLLAVELKLAKRSPTGAIAQMIGQCLIYRAKYSQVIGFLVKQEHYMGRDDDTENVSGLLNCHDIRIVIRQGET